MNRTATIILSLFLLTALAGCLIALAGSGGDPPTELYVRTLPAGAKVFIDGKEVGVSDNLFEVKPGTRKVKVELSGYEPAVKEAIIPESRIERVIFELEKREGTQKATSSPGAQNETHATEVILPDADTPGAKVILDLETGEMFEAPEKGGPEVFTKLGKGDLFFDRFLGCLRGGKAQKWDGGHFVEMEPKETKGDASAYDIPPGPCRLLITNAENRRFEVTVLSVDKKGDLTLTYRKVRQTSGKTTCEAVLERVEDHYDALVKAYKNKDWQSVDHHANEMSDLIRDEIMVGFKLDQIRELLKKRKPGEDNAALTRILRQAERIHEDLESICKSKAEMERLQTLLQSVEDYGDELHDSIRDGKIDQAPVRYAALAKAWEAIAHESFAKPGEQKRKERHFVRLVLGKDRMTFEGKDTTWEELPKSLQEVPNKERTVLEIAVASDDIGDETRNKAIAKASVLAQQIGLEYLSDIGLHPLGSKGSASEGVKGKADQASDERAADNASNKQLVALVEDFFRHNFRDVTARETIEWGDVEGHEDGNRSIRYMYLATIWGEKKLVMNQVFTFDANGKYVKYENVEGFPKGEAPGTEDSAARRNPPTNPGADAGEEAPERTVTLPDEDTPGAKVVLDLASGEMLKAPKEGGVGAFTRLGKGDLFFDRILGCLRGGKAKRWDGERFVDVEPKETRGDASAYDIPSIPYRLLITTAEKKHFDVTILSADKKKGMILAYHESRPDAGVSMSGVSVEELVKLVEDFFRHNFRDVTARDTIEWGDFKEHKDGNKSIRYMYLATIWGKKKLVMNQVFTFDSKGKFVKYENVEGFPKGEKSNESGAVTEKELSRREIGKRVSDFAEEQDLSTPESAWAAYTRASANKDVTGVVALSWVKIDPAEMERFWKNGDFEEMAIYNWAQLGSECVEVAAYREDLAAVISCLKFPPGKGRHPYSLRFFGRIDGKWKNLGEDRCPTVDAARESVRRKVKAAWRHFEQLKKDLNDEDKSGKADSEERPNSAAAPRPIKITPEIAATDVDPELNEIRVTFDRDMDTGGMSWCGGGPHSPKMDGEAKWIDKRTCVLPVKLEEGKAYRLALNWEQHQSFRSADGVPVAPTAVYFCTKGAGPELIAQMKPPKIVKLSIENGAKGVPSGRTKLSVTFDQPMDGGMSWCNGDDTPKFEPVEGEAWSEDKKTCSIMAILEPGHDYVIYLNSAYHGNFTNEVGVSSEPVVWRFSTAGEKAEKPEGRDSTAKENLLNNPGAESGDETPDAWEQDADIPGVTYSWDKNVAHEGKASLCIAKTAQRYFPIAAWSQDVERTGDVPKVELSAQVKAEKMTKAVLDVVFLDKNDKWISHKWAAYIGAKESGDPPADHDWKEYSGRIEVPDGTVNYRVGLQVYGPGKVWFDDVRLEEVVNEPGPTPAPQPIKITPEIGSTGVDPNLKEISVTFDRDMNTKGMSWCGGGPHFPKTDGEAKWIDKRTCVLPVKLEEGKAYRLALNWERYRSFRSADGVPVTPTAVYFSTKGASPELVAQMKPPKIVRLSIENGAKDVPPGRTKLSATFDQPMGAGMSWCRNGVKSVEEPVWSEDKKTCSFMAALEPGRDYRVRLNPPPYGNFMNEVGVSLEPVVWSFSTAE